MIKYILIPNYMKSIHSLQTETTRHYVIYKTIVTLSVGVTMVFL